jgi:hypothetical protein
MKPLHILSALLFAGLASCSYDTHTPIPAGHPKTVTFTKDVLLERNPRRKLPHAVPFPNPSQPSRGIVKRGTRVTFEHRIHEHRFMPGTYLLCHTHESPPRSFEYDVGDYPELIYTIPPPWDLPGGRSKW